MSKAHFSYLVCSSLLLFTTVCADNEGSYPYGTKKSASPTLPKHEETSPSHLDPFYNDGCSFWFRAKHREANGIGYDCGYTSLDAFFVFKTMNEWFPFFDARAHVFNNGKAAGNAGFGLRYLPDAIPVVFGINGFYDIKSTKHSTFQQAGVGIEALMENWEVRANGYFPVFSKNNLYAIGFDRFEGHSALFRTSRELSFKGYDLSLSRRLLQKKFFSLGTSLAGYMFFAKYGKEAKGGLLKFTSQITPSFSLELQGSYDSLFKGIVQVQAGFNIPFGKQIRTKKSGNSPKTNTALARRIAQEVDRFEIIVTDKKHTDVAGNDPRTGEPLYIVFVNNQQHAGNGSFEDPYPFLVSAQDNSLAGNMLYIFTGDGTSLKMSSGVTLKERQWLQGSSNEFTLATPYGSCNVPSQTTNKPVIQNTTGSCIVLSDDNIVTGFHISGTTTGISGANITHFTANHNSLSSSGNFDILLLQTNGTITLKDNLFSSAYGLSLASQGAVDLTVQDSIFTNSLRNMVISIAGTGSSSFACTTNTFAGAENGSSIAVANNSNVSIVIEENSFDSTASSDLYNLTLLTTANGNTTTLIRQNTFNSSQPAMNLQTDLLGNATWLVLSNTATYLGATSPLYPFSFSTDSTSSAKLYLVGNTAGADGYTFSNLSSLATFEVASPTLSLAGVEALNTGSISTSGTIDYVSYDESLIPDSP